jgi:hypothetical protein
LSHPATGNLMQIVSSLNAYAAMMREQLAAMEALSETSERLFASICRGDTESLSGILEARSAACVRLSKLASAAPPLRFDIDQLAKSEHAEISQAATDILQSTRSIELLRIKTLTRQNECEEAMRAALADTARQLREAAGEKKVRFTYQAATATSPRYLDSRK